MNNTMNGGPNPSAPQGFKRRNPGDFQGRGGRTGGMGMGMGMGDGRFGDRGGRFMGRGGAGARQPLPGRGFPPNDRFGGGGGGWGGRGPPPPGYPRGRGFSRGGPPGRGPPPMMGRGDFRGDFRGGGGGDFRGGGNFRGRGFPPRGGGFGPRGPPPPPPPPMRDVRGRGPMMPPIRGPLQPQPQQGVPPPVQPSMGPPFRQGPLPPPMQQFTPQRQHQHQPPHQQQYHAPPPTMMPAPQIQQQFQQPQAPVTQPPPPQAYTKDQIDKAWTEHTGPNSTKYYYNSITKESTYGKPEAMGGAAASAPASQSKWTEYTDPSTGKKYYSDGNTTTWEKPEELANGADGEEEDGPPRKKKKAANKKATEFGSKAEALAAFRGLLLAKGVQPTTKWNEVVKICSSDSRWEACEILSLGERKQALAEYQTKRANELKTLERQERMRAKDAFGELLTEVLPSVPDFSPVNSRYADVRELLVKHDRFHAVEDEETRETMFLEFCEEIRKREERKRRNSKREAKEGLFSFLRESEESGVLTFATTWSSFFSSLDDQQREDPRFQVSAAMSESDRELYFSDFVIELQTAEDEKRRRIRDARRRAEKAQRDAYRQTLSEMASKGSLLPSSRWRFMEETISSDPSYAPVKEQDREAPREIFEDFMEEWSETYRRDRSFLSRLVNTTSKQGITVKPDTKYDDFCKALLDEAGPSADLYSDTRVILNNNDPVSSARLYFDELVMRAKESLGTASRRRSVHEDSSEDEGEIIEDGEIKDGEDTPNLEQGTAGDANNADGDAGVTTLTSDQESS